MAEVIPLPLFHNIAGQPVIVLGDGPAAEAKRRLIERAGGVVHADMAAGLAAGARLAFVTGEAPEQDAARLRAAGVLVNVADRPDLCDFTVPALVDRAPVIIAVGTGGASAGLAKALRLRLEALLPQRLGALAQALFAARPKLRARFPDGPDRRRALDAALTAGGALDPLTDDAAARLDGWLAGAVATAGAIVEIRLTSPDPDDLTLRQARALGGADMLYHEAGVPDAILARARADAPRRIIPGGAMPPPASGLIVVLRAG